MGKVLICIESAIVDVDGTPTRIVKGQTTARQGAKILERYGDLFGEQRVDYDTTEDTTTRPRDTGRASVAKKVAARATKKAAAKKAAAPAPAEKPAETPVKKAEAPKAAAVDATTKGITTADLPGSKSGSADKA